MIVVIVDNEPRGGGGDYCPIIVLTIKTDI